MSVEVEFKRFLFRVEGVCFSVIFFCLLSVDVALKQYLSFHFRCLQFAFKLAAFLFFSRKKYTNMYHSLVSLTNRAYISSIIINLLLF